MGKWSTKSGSSQLIDKKFCRNTEDIRETCTVKFGYNKFINALIVMQQSSSPLQVEFHKGGRLAGLYHAGHSFRTSSGRQIHSNNEWELSVMTTCGSHKRAGA